MISKSQILGKFAKSGDLTPTRLANIDRLAAASNRLMAQGMKEGTVFPISPFTKNQISTDVGGFREQCCATGAPMSAHKQGLALDLFDGANGAIGKWLLKSWADQRSETAKLIKELGFYFEHPDFTKGQYTHWSHWSLVQPTSKNRFFKP